MYGGYDALNHWCQHLNHWKPLEMVIIVIIVNMAIIALKCTNFLFSRMVGIYQLSDPLLALPQETNSFCLANQKYHCQVGKLALAPVGDTRTIPFNMPRPLPEGTSADRKKGGSGDSCRMWYVNSWAMGWSRDI